ncbi:hypothetical protein INR49_021318 [Caranx melampygus]|nr:hypothetical protein INR49_021318 [Caranx melampygus]
MGRKGHLVRIDTLGPRQPEQLQKKMRKIMSSSSTNAFSPFTFNFSRYALFPLPIFTLPRWERSQRAASTPRLEGSMATSGVRGHGERELPHTSVPHAEEPKDELQLRRVKGENDKGRRDLRRRPRVEDNCKADLSHRERVASVSASSSTEEADVDAEVELQFSSDKALVLLLWRCGEPGEERLDVGNTGVWKGLLEHTQQQAVGQGKGQRKVEAWAPRQGHPGEKRKIYSAEAQLEVIVYVRPPQGKTTLKINKETGGLERQTALEDSSAGQEQDNKFSLPILFFFRHPFTVLVHPLSLICPLTFRDHVTSQGVALGQGDGGQLGRTQLLISLLRDSGSYRSHLHHLQLNVLRLGQAASCLRDRDVLDPLVVSLCCSVVRETGVGAVLRVNQQMVLQGRVAHETLAANVAGKGVGVPAVDPQVLIQLVFVPEGLSTVGAFKRAETLPDEKVLQCCVLRQKRETEGNY